MPRGVCSTMRQEVEARSGQNRTFCLHRVQLRGTSVLSRSAHLHQVLSGEREEEKVPQVGTGESLKY